ncbi:YhgE/Pip domain-containing protein [Gulosibacter molinativorax]|uniref:YhgE/Pip domain-containing protein n=1 Tax=Gulosibacter molinativorax TaxID=256821 RepID=UPI000414AF48|nr:YhgE/Pip domain-containing protein [Gulosibacter molinativorax]
MLIGLVTIPVIYASLLTSSFSDPINRLDNVPAAVVNQDVAASANGTKLDIGATLTDELVSSTAKNNFVWREYGAEEASAALDSGEVYAVLTIPRSFSSDALSVAGDHPTPAKLKIETNDGANMFAGTIAKQLGTTVADTLATQVSEEYLGNIYAGFNSAHDGFANAADGATQLADGTSEASDGAGQLNMGLDQLVTGSADLADGTVALADGAEQIDSGAQTLADGGSALHDGAVQLADGAGVVNTGAEQLRDGASQVADGTQQLADAVDAVNEAVSPLAQSVATLSEDASTLTDGASGVATSADDLLANWDALGDDEKRQLVEQLSTDAGAVRDGLDGALASMGQTDLSGVDQLGNLSTSIHDLNDGAQQVATGAADLADGTSELAGGADTLADKSGDLANGISDLADGTGTLYDGAIQVRDGAQQLSDGTVGAADGSASLADGLIQLVGGSDELATGLEDGAEQVPTYSDSESDQLSEVAADPVQFDELRRNEVARNGDGMAPYFMALGLWVGGIGFYLMNEPLARAKGSGPSFVDALRSFLPGAAMAVGQSILLFVAIHGLVGVEYANPAGLLSMMLLASVTFIAINQALIALLGAPGRYFALILIVLQLASAGATYPVETAPELFQALNPWLPLPYAVDAFRSLIAGGSIGVADAVTQLLVWLAVALAMTTLAIMLKRVKDGKTSWGSNPKVTSPAVKDSASASPQGELTV